MKKIEANRQRRPVKNRMPRQGRRGRAAASAPPPLTDYRVTVDPDGREHFAVPLIGPRHPPGMPYLIAHFSLPPPKERETLLDELACTIARAAVEERLKESSRDGFTD